MPTAPVAATMICSEEETASLPLASPSSSDEERSRRIEDLLPLVRHIVGRMAMHLPPHLSKDDMIGAGVVGLMEAVDRYDEGRGCSLKTFCSLRIRGAILDELRRHDWVPRSVHRDARQLRQVHDLLAQQMGREPTEEELRQEMGLDPEEFGSFLDRVRPIRYVSMQEAVGGAHNHESLSHEEVVADVRAHDGCHLLLEEEDREILRHQIKALPSQQLQVLTLYYMEELRLREIAEILKLTESRVSQIHTLAISRLRAAFERARRR